MVAPERLRIIFMGTSEFAKIILKKIFDEKNLEIAGVFAQPDKPSGRGLKKIEYGAVKKFVIDNRLDLYQPISLNDPDVIATVKELNPDFIVVAAYGKIIPESIISIPKFDCINVHASLLPAFRGAAPIQRAIMESWNGRKETGVSIMRVVRELDAGPIYTQQIIPIGNHSSDFLFHEIAEIGSDLLIKTIYDIVNKNLEPQEQEHNKATYAHKLTKEDGFINCNNSVDQIDAQIRAVKGWPGSRMNVKFDDENPPMTLEFTVSEIKIVETDNNKIGNIIRENGNYKILCKNGYLILSKIKPQGKKWMDAKDFFNGKKIYKKDVYGIII